jgi:hypothetical protein
MAKSKLDFQEVTNKGGFRVPTNTPNKFPKIIKYGMGR